MRVKPDPLKIVDIYLDETSQTKHRYLMLGAVIVNSTAVGELDELLSKARADDLPAGEVKWGKVSKTKLPAYKRIVDVLFDNPNLFHFHSLFVDTHQHDHAVFNDGSREIGFNKEIYQLAMKVARLYRDDQLFHLYPDYRETTQSPDDLRLILNRGCRKRGDTRDWPFRRCQFRDSKTVQALQLADVLIGALAYQLNGHLTAKGASPAKVGLCQHVLKRSKISEVLKGTAVEGTFTVWPRRLKLVSQP